ncbi:putative type II restriction endonuclease [Desulfuromonas soudanensis]|uniref:Putative type II restriction endonuclease n=1 Tax=Desulfuromonas soudanensis TaxID=1603606 RepID=A0A0M4D460_9BACT|nr:type II restriction endonuclease [Desulfuromonas soudanensis]ALC15322.1 putative type II restriction endonuclease [Desulfuromonas soudanensis]
MALSDLSDWMDENTGLDCVWFVKRLSANDTLANETHQAGPYIPREFLFRVFPEINRPDVENPDCRFVLSIDSHMDRRIVRAIWYNKKLHGTGTRNEARITGFGGRGSALLDPENTGALAIFAFLVDEQGAASKCRVWVCRTEIEESLVEDRIGPIDPGQSRIWAPNLERTADLYGTAKRVRTSCYLQREEIPLPWLVNFPSGAEIVSKTIEFKPAGGMNPDTRLLARRKCEFEMFRSIEEAIELPNVLRGFLTIDEFLARAQTILQRRKARSGRSLELHALEIFLEEGLVENENFTHQPESEHGKRPDFLFPSAALYKTTTFPASQLRMLAVKTTCKDRWRQIINEADRIKEKHLLTLQEGVSVGQFHEMTEAGVRLVVPEALKSNYNKKIQPYLQSLESFISDIRLLTGRLR